MKRAQPAAPGSAETEVAVAEPLVLQLPIERVPLELQPILNQAYRNGAYDDIDYTQEPQPPLDPDDAGWMGALLRAKGLRR